MAVPNGLGPLNRGNGEPCPSSCWCLWRVCGGWQFPTARANQLAGQGVLPRWRSVPMDGLRGTAVPNGLGPPAGGTGIPAEAAVRAYGGPAEVGSSQRSGPPKSRERGVLPRRRSLAMERLWGRAAPNGPGPLVRGTGSCRGGGPYPGRACGVRQFPTARGLELEGPGVLLRR